MLPDEAKITKFKRLSGHEEPAPPVDQVDSVATIPLIINTLTIIFKNMEKNIHSLSEYIC